MKQATAPPVKAPLYPELPAGPADNDNTPPDQYFRLQEILRLRKFLEDEKDKRSQLYKKYRRGINAVDALDTALISASMGMGIGGVGLLTTVIAAPVVLGLEIAALGCGLLGVAGKFIGRRLSVKAKKHDEVRVLAESKLNTIADHVSRALTDGQISDEEFRLIREAGTRPGQVSWRNWPGHELCVPLEHLDAGMLLRMRQRERKGWPAPVEPLGRRGGGPSSQGLLAAIAAL